MKKFIAFADALLTLTFCLAVPPASAQKKTSKSSQPQNVVDYLKILPKSCSKIVASTKDNDRLSLIKIDNRKTDFLRLEAANFTGWTEIALFKKKSGGHLVAVNEYDFSGGADEGGFGFYEYNKGIWKQVEPLPHFTYGDLLTAFSGKTNRQATEEEMNRQIYELHQPNAQEITMKIGGGAVYGFRWNGTDFKGGMLYLDEAN